MPRLQRDPPQRMFTAWELRRLMSMIFMLAVLFMVIQQTRKTGSVRWLIGRSGDKDQIVGKIDDRDDAPETTPAPPEHPATVAIAAAHTGTESPAAATDTKAAPAAPASKAPAKSDQPPSASKPAEKGQASPAKPGESSSPTKPSINPPENPAAEPAAQPPDSNVPESNPPAAAAPAAEPAPKIPPATGPTDEDSREAAAAGKDFGTVYDQTPGILPAEGNAYDRILRWVVHQPYERLASRVTQKDPPWGQFITTPDESRRPGRIYQMDIHLINVEKVVGPEQVSADGALPSRRCSCTR